MLTRFNLSKKRNTEKLTKLFAVTEEIKLDVNFRDSSHSLAYPLYKLALTRNLPELTKKRKLKLNAFSEKLSSINLSQTMKGQLNHLK